MVDAHSSLVVYIGTSIFYDLSPLIFFKTRLECIQMLLRSRPLRPSHLEFQLCLIILIMVKSKQILTFSTFVAFVMKIRKKSTRIKVIKIGKCLGVRFIIPFSSSKLNCLAASWSLCVVVVRIISFSICNF